MTPRGVAAASPLELEDLPRGSYEILDAGERCRTLGGGRPRLTVYAGGCSSPWGHHVDGKFQYDTTLFGINPMHIGNFENGYRHWDCWMQAGKDLDIMAELDTAFLVPGLWDNNYQHFITESLPQIHYIKSLDWLSDLPIIVNDQPHIREITSLCYGSERFIYCPDGKFVKTRRHLLHVQPITRNFDDIGEASARALRHLRKTALGTFLPPGDQWPPADKTVFFGRLALPSNAGRARVMTNEAEARDLFEQRAIEFRTFDQKSIAEKAAALLDVGTIITPLGANLMNLLFARQGARVIVIGHPVFKQTAWFGRLAAGMDLSLTMLREFTDVTLGDTQEINVNAPFAVDIPALTRLLDELAAA